MHPRPLTKQLEEQCLTQIVKWSSLDFAPLLSTTSLSKLSTQGAWVNQLEEVQLLLQPVSILLQLQSSYRKFALTS